MAVNLSPVGGVAAQFFTNDGVPLAGGLIYTYAAGTNTPAATYTNTSGTVFHSNPIVLDSAGRVPGGEIWLTDGISYKFVLKDSTGALIATYDNVVGINSNFVGYTSKQEIQTATAGQTVFTLTTMAYQPGTNNLSVFVDGVNQYGPGASYAFVETSSTSVTFVSGLHVGAEVKFTTASPVATNIADAANVSYLAPYLSAETQTVEEKLAQYVSVKDFGATGDGTTDDSTTIQAALDSGQPFIYIPSGYYRIASTLVVPSTVKIIAGDGIGGSTMWSDTAAGDYLLNVSAASVSLRDFTLYGGDEITTPITTPTNKNGILANGTGNNALWSNVNLYGFDTGIFVGALASTVYMMEFSHIQASLCNTGMRVDQGMHQSAWVNCQFRACVDYGLRFLPSGAAYEVVATGIYNCTFERTSSGTGAGLWVENARGMDISACYFEANVGRSIYLYGTSINGLQGVSIHNCYFFEYSAFAGNGHGIEVVGPYCSGINIENNHFEAYLDAGYFPIVLANYSGITTFIQNNIFNNCTGNSYQIQSDYGYLLNDYGAINNQTIVRASGRTDGSGNLASLNIGKFSLANNTGTCVIKVTTVRVSDDVSAVKDETVNFIRAFVSAGVLYATVSTGAPTGVTFSVGSTITYGTSYNANLNVVVSAGAANCNMGFIAELAYTNNGTFVGNNVISSSYS
jgi:hypothetical protein